MEPSSKKSRSICPIAAILVAAVLLCGYFTAPARADDGQGSQALAEGKRDMIAGHFRQAIRLFRQAAVKGNGLAMFGIGFLYDRGEGVPKDEGRAMAWWRKAAAKGGRAALLALKAITRAKGGKKMANQGR
ncbi:MAG: hypothetical protein ACP5QA_05620 [Phycisphaerae bacterium]